MAAAEGQSDKMQKTLALWSPKLIRNKHPKNAVMWKPDTAGFWKPKYSASKMKWHFQLPYRRKFDSLLHYPETSKVTGNPVDW